MPVASDAPSSAVDRNFVHNVTDEYFVQNVTDGYVDGNNSATLSPIDSTSSVWALVVSEENGSSNEKIDESDIEIFSYDLKVFLVICAILGVVVLVGNVFILAVSKYASGGKSPTLVFVRSLCVADAVAGVSASWKGIQASGFLIQAKELKHI